MSESAAGSTRLGRVARATCLGFLVLMGCDGSKGAGDGGILQPPGSDAAPAACGSFNACGGSVVGTWKLPGTVECGPSSSGTTTPPPCEGYTQTGDAQIGGTIVFSTNGTWRMTLTADGSYQVSYPVTCMGGSQCPTTTEAEPGYTLTCGESSPGRCRCDFVYENYSVTSGEGTYTASGGKLTTVESSEGTEDTVDYCVQGSTLRLRGVDEDTGEPMTVALTKQ